MCLSIRTLSKSLTLSSPFKASLSYMSANFEGIFLESLAIVALIPVVHWTYPHSPIFIYLVALGQETLLCVAGCVQVIIGAACAAKNSFTFSQMGRKDRDSQAVLVGNGLYKSSSLPSLDSESTVRRCTHFHFPPF